MKEPKIKTLGLLLDCSRDAVHRPETLKQFIDIVAGFGYNMLQLYTEDTYEIDDEPHFGYMRGRYTKDELKEIDAYAASKGIELVPCIQTLAHLGGFAVWKSKLFDFDDILLAGDEAVYELIDKMFKTCAECFTSRRINIGMDEAHMVGLGKYLDKHGYENRSDIFLKHLSRVCEIADKYGFKPMMWSDMFFRLACHEKRYQANAEFDKSVLDVVPKNVELVYWEYYVKDKDKYDSIIKTHKKFDNNIIFAGGAWSWIGFVPHNKGCFATHDAAIASCLENGIDEIIMTVWKDDGAECSLFSILPALCRAAELSRGNSDMDSIKKKFADVVGVSFDVFMSLDAPDNIEDDDLFVNPCKYMLYSDPFLGIFDTTVVESKAAKFAEAKKKLAVGLKNKKYGYMFKTLSSLCDVMEIKYGLSVRTHRAYKTKDKAALKAIIEEYLDLEEKLKLFYDDFRNQWHKENKRFGFEKQSVRIGAQMCRLQDCRRILEDYVSGKLDSIEELEEEVLPWIWDWPLHKAIAHNTWLHTALIKYKP